ncbi:MAG: hypothetical protein EZS28_011890 [Streblomastix strix]|uniref:Uncharacterized protein n=1 Tax=Streblomastix strix TaxID=222440 RepID=A0A5J4WD28_9EUKA|nr:MAG: hypothetical protein EZS28_011890 [Streblomastix strix]
MITQDKYNSNSSETRGVERRSAQVLNQSVVPVKFMTACGVRSMSKNRWDFLDLEGDEALDLGKQGSWGGQMRYKTVINMRNDGNAKEMLQQLHGRQNDQRRTFGEMKFWEKLKLEIRERIVYERDIKEIIYFNQSNMVPQAVKKWRKSFDCG